MRTLIFFAIIGLCGLYNGTATGQSTNTVPIANTSTKFIPFLKREVKTNDLSCVLQFTSRDGLTSMHPPVCWVTVLNHTTNNIRGVVGPAPCLFAIELFDSNGKLVEKTSIGKKFGTPLSQEEIKSWWPVQRGVSYRLPIFTSGPNPPLPGIQVGTFSVSDAFQVKEAGEYTLHLRMRFIQTKVDISGHAYFPIIWLPEVTTKVQIQPGDIPSEKLLPIGQTNYPGISAKVLKLGM
jgi:hypothetical protein